MRLTQKALLTLGTCLALHAQSAHTKQAEVDHVFGGFNTHTAGCAVGVADHGAVALTSGYGMADLERAVPITADTVFESGSVAKQFTAMSMVLLAKQGKISLDDPLNKYLTELPDYGTPLTIRQVLSHISGLREWRPIAILDGMPEGTVVLNNHDLLRFAAAQHTLNFPPGAAYSYTNTGFNILTILLERALGNGKTFQDFTREQIFEPLHMTHTRWRDDFRAVVPNRALAYSKQENGDWVQDTPVENIIGAGGLLTTVGDWLLWNENFSTAKVGGPDSLQILQTPATLNNGQTIGYAMGLAVGAHDGLREISHSGATGGYRTFLARYPEKAVSVAVMCNDAHANPIQLGRETARLWTGAAPAPKSAEAQPDTVVYAKLTGSYRRLRDNSVAVLHTKEGKLFLDDTVLTRLSTTDFTAAGGDVKVIFNPRGFEETTPNGNIAYERFEPTQPSASDLAGYAGTYQSSEVTNSITIAITAGNLTLQIGAADPLPLKPTFQDAFMARGSAWKPSVLFRRDSTGKVTSLSIGDDRAWDIRFSIQRQ